MGDAGAGRSPASDLDVARRLYAAFAAADAVALLDALDPEFRGVVTAGLPNGWGGVYEGREEMLRECWGSVFGELAVAPVPDEYLAAGDGRIVVSGFYRGRARRTGRSLDAAFVHLLRFREARVVELVQVTDSAAWHDALRE